MLAFLAKKMLSAVKQHAEQEYAADSAKPHKGLRKTIKMRDGFEAEWLLFAAKRPNAPLLADFYGGGYIGGNVYKEAPLCERYRDTLDINVAALSYRYGPDHKHPTAVHDAYDALLALYNDKSLDFDRSRIIIEGHSAGAHLTASLALYNIAHENIPLCALILDYPIFDVRRDFLKKLPKVKYGVPAMVSDFMYYGYFDDEQKASDPLSRPILASDEVLKKLPPAYINVCENDSLKFGAKEFCDRMRALGCETMLTETKGAVHGYVEQCSNDTMRTLKDYPADMNKNQYTLYEQTFRQFCAYIKEWAGL